MTVIVDAELGLRPGERVGSYEVIDVIGGGGMGMVYRASHVLLERPAAIKVLRAEYDHVPAIVHRFFTEARLTTAIRHPGIVEVYDFGHTADGHAYIAMELLAGDSLARRLRRIGRLPWPTAALVARRIASALAAAHDRGVAHRDLKPDNIHLIPDPDGGAVEQIKLLDFGIAKVIGAAGDHRTTTGVVMGTPAYMAPEQCRGLADTDHRVDLYALGCVLHEMLVGRPPFVARTSNELIEAHLHVAPDDVRARGVAVPAALAELVAALLAKDPEARPASADAVARALDRICGAPTPRRRPTAPLWAGAAGLVAVVLGLVFGRSARRGTTALVPPPEVDARRATPAAATRPPAPAPLAPLARPVPDATAPTVLGPPAALAIPPAGKTRPGRPRRVGRDDVTPDLDPGEPLDGLTTVVRDPR